MVTKMIANDCGSSGPGLDGLATMRALLYALRDLSCYSELGMFQSTRPLASVASSGKATLLSP